MKLISGSAEETTKLGERIGKILTGGEFIKLSGELGCGKTQLTKGIAVGLGITENVISPTFTIERVYKAGEASKLELHHFDFYRLDEHDEEISQELSELVKGENNVIVVEWPENIERALPAEFIELKFNYVDENIREIEMTASGEKYERILDKIDDTCN